MIIIWDKTMCRDKLILDRNYLVKNLSKEPSFICLFTDFLVGDFFLFPSRFVFLFFNFVLERLSILVLD